MSAHWLASEVGGLRALAETYESARTAGDRGSAEARERYLSGLRVLVEQIALHPGVSSAFCAHQGLLLAAAGPEADQEVLAAMTEWCVVPAQGAAKTLGLGELGQLLISGAERKLAIVQVGDISLGVLCPLSVNLSALLAEGPHA